MYPQWGSEQKYFLYFPNISEGSAILKSLIHHAKSVQASQTFILTENHWG